MNTRQPQPVDPAELLHVVSQASSQNADHVQQAAKRLQKLCEMFGTFEGLQEIAVQKELPLVVRQQAIIQFKNSALSHWKSRRYLSNEHRDRIRSRCLTLVYEEDDLIAHINEHIVAKIARSDYPGSWPNLLPDIMSMIDGNLQARYSSSSSDVRITLVLRRSLKLLNAILKEFSSVRMLNGVRVMSDMVEKLHGTIYAYYAKVSSSLATLDPPTIRSTRVAEEILLSHLLFKVVVKIAAWLWNKIQNMSSNAGTAVRAWVEELFQNSAHRLKTFSELRINLILALRSSGLEVDTVSRQCIDQLTRHVRLYGKFFRRLQQIHPRRFVSLPTCGDVVMYYWSKVVQATDGPLDFIADTNEAVFPTRFLVQALALFKECVAQWSPSRTSATAVDQVLSAEFVEGAVLRLVTRFIPLNPNDLEGWMADPEDWLNTEGQENEQWEFQLRPCAERVLMTLSNQYQQYVVPVLENKLKEVSSRPTVELPDVLEKEAVYCAIGRCAARMSNVIPFNQWVDTILLPEVMNPNPNFPIIKRRIAWLLGKWIGEECAPANNPKVWEVLSHLLHDRGPGTDAVVRLTAATTLSECVDSKSFDLKVFAPFLPSAVSDLVKILGESETLESKRRAARTLTIVIEQSGSRIVPLIGVIAEPIPQLWSAAGTNLANTDWLLKGSILSVLKALIEAAQEHSLPLAVIVIPIIRESISPGTLVHLDHDALGLWQSVLRNAVTMESVNGAPSLLELFPTAVSLLAENLDLLGQIITIHESYLLLDAPRILQGFGQDLCNAFYQALKNPAIIDMNSKGILSSIELLVQLTPSSHWAAALHNSGLFAHLINVFVKDEKSVPVQTAHIYVLARIAISDSQAFLQLMSLTAQRLGHPETYVWEVLLDQWWNRFDNMSEPRHRKLTAMGIAALVATGRPDILKRLPTETFNLWLDVFGEIKESVTVQDGESAPALSLLRHWEQEKPEDVFSDIVGTPEFSRRKAAYGADPVRETRLNAYVGAMLQTAESICGAQHLQVAYLSEADPLVLSQIQNELQQG